tara:strand:- start:37 stop:354 length:318 start_codon:yes stop_codon:yes gene_type:complete
MPKNLLYSLPYDIQRKIYMMEHKDKKMIHSKLSTEFSILEYNVPDGERYYIEEMDIYSIRDRETNYKPSHVKPIKKLYFYCPHYSVYGDYVYYQYYDEKMKYAIC